MIFRYRRRSRTPAFSGGFPDDGESVTELIERTRIPDWDARTTAFTGASGAGPGPAGLGTLTVPVAVKETGRDTEPFTRPAPPPPRRAEPDCAIPVLTRDGPGILCGMCRWRRHADPATLSFRELRRSAWLAGWRTDLFGSWCCPPCQGKPGYRASRPLAHWHPDAARARGCAVQTEDGWRDAELWARVLAEHDMIRGVHEAAQHGRHERSAR